MAGFLAQERQWERVEKKWKATLKSFGVPHFHMKDFAHFQGFFLIGANEAVSSYSENSSLHLESINPIPIGIIFDMNAFRSLPAEKVQHLAEPYTLSCAAMLSFTAGMLNEMV